MIDILKFIRSMSFAIQGIANMIMSENNARIHALATIFVVVMGFYCHLTISEWLWISLAIALVWILEAINTAIEALVDLAAPDFHPLAKKAKDIAAGGVLIGAILAVIIGALVFLPKFLI
jgi:diacylglycerol kinase